MNVFQGSQFITAHQRGHSKPRTGSTWAAPYSCLTSCRSLWVIKGSLLFFFKFTVPVFRKWAMATMRVLRLQNENMSWKEAARMKTYLSETWKHLLVEEHCPPGSHSIYSAEGSFSNTLGKREWDRVWKALGRRCPKF